MSKKFVKIFTDGACRGNPGVGGWGALLKSGAHEKTLYGAQAHTTNNKMELMAAIKALEALKSPCEVVLVTDSQYLRRGVLEWMDNWKRNNWRTSSKKSVKNKELWEELDNLIVKHDITWQWVKGHNGHPENERADQLANQAIDEYLAGMM